MDMKLLAVVTPTPAIYHGLSTHKTFWEDNFTPVNMTGCGKRNVRKHKEINNDDQYIILEIYFNINFMKKEVSQIFRIKGLYGNTR